ncbi:condensin subunit ScpB [Candidatus Koribacter versatilis Ellin345]|uniref:Condensin subunit ScpB n=1 Tax=Koribacter versatilis (strain Ellin345) TaxID=204669 RepID=Q1IJT8_KORVE|nr:SMC-Scp complex subunit ScpB [Candidatus Koribacter versatilis]ABF42862.1 condensin subunit ScpB [Candidatus Koribacter versatilis Ellin345]
MSLKGKIEAIIYAAEEPVTVDQMAALLRDIVLAEIAQEASNAAAAEETANGETAQADAAAAEGTTPEPHAESAPETPSEVTGEAAVEPDAATEVSAPETTSKKKAPKDPELTAVKAKLRTVLAELVADYQSDARGLEIRQIAGGYRMATKPEHHDVVVGFAKSLKPPIRLSLQALETLAVVAYKQPVTAPEVSEIRGVDSSGVIATLLDRKLVTTAGRKQVIGRPILYKTTKEFLLRFGLKDVNELPSMEEFEKLGDAGQGVLFEAEQKSAGQSASDEAARADDEMMAREEDEIALQDDVVARAAEASGDANASEDAASAATEETKHEPAHAEANSESAADTSEVQGSTNENA